MQKFGKIMRLCTWTRSYTSLPRSMRAWQLAGFSNNEQSIGDDLFLSESLDIPAITEPSQLLIEVHASTLNPLDLRMATGYGHSTMHNLRRLSSALSLSSCGKDSYSSEQSFSSLVKTPAEFPLILGRDFSGVVRHAGPISGFQVGQPVFGVKAPQLPGTLSQFIVADARTEVAAKPDSLSHAQASSLVYVGLTSLAAICDSGRISIGQNSKRSGESAALVIGAFGGVGRTSVQIMRALNLFSKIDILVRECNEESQTNDTPNKDEQENEQSCYDAIHTSLDKISSGQQRYDFILDCSSSSAQFDSGQLARLLRNPEERPCASLVLLNHPTMANTDRFNSLSIGMAAASLHLLRDNLAFSLANLASARRLSVSLISHLMPKIRWALFRPSRARLELLARLADEDATHFRLPIDSEFAFHSVPEAFRRQISGDVRGGGKIVINHCEFARPD